MRVTIELLDTPLLDTPLPFLQWPVIVWEVAKISLTRVYVSTDVATELCQALPHLNQPARPALSIHGSDPLMGRAFGLEFFTDSRLPSRSVRFEADDRGEPQATIISENPDGTVTFDTRRE